MRTIGPGIERRTAPPPLSRAARGPSSTFSVVEAGTIAPGALEAAPGIVTIDARTRQAPMIEWGRLGRGLA
jgi:hypothetical protein